jgi:hypothetical protein
MRCMACGANMVLTAVVPDETMMVRGFEHQTFRCLDCNVTEERLTFTGGAARRAQLITPVPVVQAAQSAEAPRTPVAAARPQDTPHQQNGAAAGAWIRAVEKVRSRQAEIRERAEGARRTDWNIEFNRAWEQLAPGREQAVQNEHPSYVRPKDLASMYARAVHGRLRKSSRLLAGRNGARPGSVTDNPEAMLRFNRFWESLGPGGIPLGLPAAALTASIPSVPPLLPLPSSMSLVPIEAVEPATMAARAILFLRGVVRPRNPDEPGNKSSGILQDAGSYTAPFMEAAE